ncbi:putative ammonium transporter [Emiliania huxleyi CCMP1516]|uniref:Ammonium transporter AmtB-like domain-containing protein n=2 Tax=Emiliania huxleyi TaxID=2903 RepID=A0A0D3HY93_EMIH1|nr:putative ammonium transporter [Emiliania huxleyi CCMP1516]EOD03978.1 putative ammonium transporter [Emiliania huxleyi CCMP1516]|eukprot:XP_005756407.1 putative ammonium transporter [Emiliania huxleyi CCMP1516]
MEDEDLKSAINVAWVLLCTALVFWEQAGFAMWEAGCLRSTSLHSILLKNMCDAAIGAAAFFTLGYAIGFGGGADHKFAGNDKFFLKGVAIDDYHIVFFQWAFAATAATTVSGCMAERTQFAGYLIYSFFVTAFIYAVPLHWLWADAGWLCAWGDNAAFGYGMIDFAGSGIVHMLGGAAGLVGSYVVGPRAGRFTDKGPVQIEGHSITLTTLGVYCLWFGWFGFNAGYTLEPLRGGAFIGIVSGGRFFAACGRLHERLRIDDPVHAGAVHAWPGFWGCIASGLFAWPKQVATLGYVGGGGLFYTGHGGQFGTNVLGTLVVLAWTVATSSIVFGSLQAAKLLRVTAEEEEMGVDLAEHLPRDGVTPLKSKMMGAVMRHRGSGSGASSRACGASETTATYA